MPESLPTLRAFLSLFTWHGRDILRVMVEVLMSLQQLLLAECLVGERKIRGTVMETVYMQVKDDNC